MKLTRLFLGCLGSLFVFAALGCATAEDPDFGVPIRGDAATDARRDANTKDSASDARDAGNTPDTAVADARDTGTTNPPEDTGTTNPPEDTGTTNPPVDSGTTNPPADSGTTNPLGYGPPCISTAQCISWGYACCAWLPDGVVNLGCGSIAIGNACLPRFP